MFDMTYTLYIYRSISFYSLMQEIISMVTTKHLISLLFVFIQFLKERILTVTLRRTYIIVWMLHLLCQN